MLMDRIIQMTEVDQPSDNDYVHLQSPTLGDRRIKANNLGNGGGGESIDGIYYDGTSTNLLRIWTGGELEQDRDFEFDVTFYTPSYQNSTIIFGNTANGYYPCCFMTNNVFRVNSGTGSQVDYVPDSFEGEHHLILNRLNDRAIVFDGDTIGTYSGANYCLGYGTGLELGRAFDISAAQFVLKEFKLTKQNNSEVVADFKAGFRALSNGYKIPCLLNTIDNTYIDLNYGRPSGNNEGHIMLCQKTT